MTQANIDYWNIQGGVVIIVFRLKGSLEQAEQWHPGSRYKSRRNKSQMASFPNFTKIFVRRWPKRTWTLCQMKRLIMINSSGNICYINLTKIQTVLPLILLEVSNAALFFYRYTCQLESFKNSLKICEFYPEKNPHESKIKREYGNKAYQNGKDLDALFLYTQVT